MAHTKNFTIFFGILALVLAATGGLFFGLQSQRVISSSELSNNVISGQDEMVNWKTYTNTKYSFEFKYPSELGNLLETEPVMPGYGRNDQIHDFEVYLRSDDLNLSLEILLRLTSGESTREDYGGSQAYSPEQWDFEKEFLFKNESGTECSFLWASRFSTIENECQILNVNGTKMIVRVLWWPPGDSTGMSYTFYKDRFRYDFYIFSDEFMTPDPDKSSTDKYTQVRLLTLEEIKKLPRNSAIMLGQQILSTFRFK